MQNTIRTARETDRAELTTLINTAFSANVTGMVPHLLTPARLADHFVCEADGRLAGVIGLYPHGYRYGDVEFRAAGIGQVATDPAMRGRGVMSQLLTAVGQAADSYDFTWLFGDHQRYARYGWALGGRQYLFTTFDRYLPLPPDSSSVEVLPVRDMAPRILAALARQPQTLTFPAEEVEIICTTGSPSQAWHAWALGDAWLLFDEQGARVFMADGDEEHLTLLLAHAARELRAMPGDQWLLSVTCPIDITPLLRACRPYHWQVTLQHAANIRVGNLSSLLSKMCQLAQPRVEHGNGTLSLQNIDTGQSATLHCAHGILSVTPEATPTATRLTTLQLSELLFGLLPLDALLPDLPPASPFRQVLPLPVSINRLFAL